jgi:hypothetical protein
MNFRFLLPRFPEEASNEASFNLDTINPLLLCLKTRFQASDSFLSGASAAKLFIFRHLPVFPTLD